MPSNTSATGFAGRLSAVLIVLSLAAAARADVHDDAHVFGQPALDWANSATERMDRQYGKQLVVETFAAVPPEQRAALATDKAAFFKRWMADRAKSLRVNGVYVLICMDPKFLEAGAGAQTRQNGIFTAADLVKLRQRLQAELRGGKYDLALSNAVRMVADTYAANIPNAKPLDLPPQPPAPPEPTTAPMPTTLPTMLPSPATRPAR